MGVAAVTWIVNILKLLRGRTVLFRYPRREGVVALVLFAAALIVAVTFYLGGVKNAFNPGAGLLQPLYQRLTLAAICAILFGIALVVRQQPWRSAGISRPFIPALEFGLALALLTIFLRNKIYTLIAGVQPEQWSALAACLGLALLEESIFRGFIQLRLSAWLGERWGWLATAGLFTLWNLPRLTGAWDVILMNAGLILAQAVLLGWVMQKSGHILAPGLYRAVAEWILFLG